MTTFIKQNNDPIAIEYVEDEHDGTRDFQPSFWWWNQRYYLEDFGRCHNNPWIGLGGDFPEYIHGYQNDGSCWSFERPLYIELIDDETINLYYEEELS